MTLSASALPIMVTLTPPPSGLLAPLFSALSLLVTDNDDVLMQDRKKDTDVYNGLLDSEGEGGMIWENGILTCILS